MRQTALQSIKSTAEDLINQAGSDQDEAVKGIMFFLCGITMMKLIKDKITAVIEIMK